MPGGEDAVGKLSGETKALVLVHEYRIGHQVLPELRILLDAFAASDLERIGILELIRRKAGAWGLEEEKREELLRGLGAEESTETLPGGGSMAHGLAHTVRVRRGDAPPKEEEGTKPAAGFAFRHGREREMSTVRLPFRKPPEAETQTPPPPSADQPYEPNAQRPSVGFTEAGATLPRPKRVLVADDDTRIRFLYRTKLDEAGYVVDEAATGLEAWEKIQAETYDLVVTDMKMPGLHGLELLARLTDAGATMPVIVCTAYDQLKKEFTVSTYPKLRYLVKPVPIEKLLDAVREMTASAAE